jgi:hypothetical protein
VTKFGTITCSDGPADLLERSSCPFCFGNRCKENSEKYVIAGDTLVHAFNATDGPDLSGLSAPSLTDRDASIFGNNILFRVFFATVIDAEQAAGAF